MTGSPAKPKLLDPCNNCGRCCRDQLCALASATLEMPPRAPGPCPALVEREDGTGVCGMVLDPAKWAPGHGNVNSLRQAAELLICSGVGCDATDESTPENRFALALAGQRYVTQHGRENIENAMMLWHGIKI